MVELLGSVYGGHATKRRLLSPPTARQLQQDRADPEVKGAAYVEEDCRAKGREGKGGGREIRPRPSAVRTYKRGWP